jgi:glycosyltransferase involved in cell wall biosynthesis
MAGFDLQIYAREALFGKNDLSWDVIVALITYWRHFVHLLPVSGQIKNIGFDSRGTNIGLLSAILSFFYHNRNVTRSAYISHSWIENVKINCRYNLELVHFVRKVHSSSIMIQLHRLLDKFRVNEINKNNRINNLDLMRTPKEKLTKRALFSYIVHPFSIVRDDPRVYGHMNIWHAQEIVRNLNRLGYLVDVIDYRYKDVQINDDGYDLFIGHGGENFYKLCMQLKAGIPKIFFATGSYWEFHNEQEKKRFENLSLRKGKMLTYDRIISSDEEKALFLADGIIGIGNECTRSTYKKYQNVFMINGNALYDDFADWCYKDFENGRNNFLFFSGRGNVHKGLDLLIETFSQLSLHLWVCTKIEPQFYKLYSRELSQARNIHLIGWVLPRTKRYYEIIQKCNFVILPSCSEGQSQSIIECMWQGLIPVVSRYCGVDVDEYGYYIDPCTVEQIKKVVLMLSTMPVKDYIEISSRVRLSAQSQFSEETFSKNFRIVLMTLLNDIQKVG